MQIVLLLVGSGLAISGFAMALDESRAVQATALATLALCVLTGWYAFLTQRLVLFGSKQAQDLRRAQTEKERSEALILANLADRVGAGMRELPHSNGDNGFDNKIREGALWSRDDLREMEKLSAQVGPWASGPLVSVTNYLLWMDARIREVQAEPRSRGFDYARLFDFDKWEHAWSESDKHLAVVAKLAKDRAGHLGRELEKDATVAV